MHAWGRRILRWGVVLIVLLVVFSIGRSCAQKPVAAPEAAAVEGVVKADEIWTCSMHPQIRRNKPGQCPICGMDLIPVKPSAPKAAAGSAPRFVTSPDALKLMDVETAPVERRFVDREVRMVGKVDYDETRLAYLSAWVAGRLDRLYVDFTGVTVRKGDHMVDIYSPELLAAQEELLQAARFAQQMGRDGAPNALGAKTLDAAREKLRLWGLTPEQVAEIEKSGQPQTNVTLYAPVGGVVIRKQGQVGMYVQTGTPIYTISDLSTVWVKLDAYESDLEWLRYGQKASVVAEAMPGESITGTVSFIDPVLDAATRTAGVRVNVPNPDGKLKPGMFVHGVVHVQIASEGKVVSQELAGKWICPMHAEVLKDAPGKCDICGMDLVTTESLGYVPAATSEAPLVVPATAPLVTGTRAVVYVRVPDTEEPTFEGRVIEIGPRAGDYYLVKSGLVEGEQVVTRGNFKIDSSLQIEGKPSMMQPEGGAAPLMHHAGMEMPKAETAAEEPAPEQAAVPTPPAAEPVDPTPTGAVSSSPEPDMPMPAAEPNDPRKAFALQLDAFLNEYFAVADALAADKADETQKAAGQAREALGRVDMKLLSGPDHMAWMRSLPALQKAMDGIAGARKITAQREAFATLADDLTALLHLFGTAPERTVYRIHCPMAFKGRGADWFQKNKETRNPYFGAAMLKCGEIVETFGLDAATGEEARPNE
jgi:Cu(I)/Ag(I) efflux system membrane fusion protein